MSFSSDVKQELNKNTNLANKDIVKNELLGYFISGNTNVRNHKEIKFSTEKILRGYLRFPARRPL